MLQKIYFSTSDNLKLCGIWHYPKTLSLQAIVLAHGITIDKDEKGIFVDLANLLAEKGFAVFRFDFRGSGESNGQSTDITVQNEILDLQSAVQVVQKQYKEIGLLGASFGGSIATLFTSENQNILKSLCLWNPALNFDHAFLNPISPWLKERSLKMQKDLKVKGWTTLGSRKFILSKAWYESLKNVYPYKELRTIKIPILIIQGDKDTKISCDNIIEYGKDIAEIKILKGAEHGFHTHPYKSMAIESTYDFFRKTMK